MFNEEVEKDEMRKMCPQLKLRLKVFEELYRMLDNINSNIFSQKDS